MALLWLAHLPYLLVYWISLWKQPHYQFFPFALGAFVWLFVTRRSPASRPSGIASKMLIGFDVLCLIVGIVLNSPWIVAFGLLARLLDLCLTYKDEGYHRSLWYLILLPLTTIRLPANSDEFVIQWLQRVTTSIASQLLNQLGMLHAREGNIIQFPGKSFLVAEACSGVQSLFTILFLAALVICLRRRSIAHGIVLLASGFVFAGTMNVARVMMIAVAWKKYNYDLSVGLAHECLGYCCLGVAAALLMSADACLGFFLDRVLDRTHLNPEHFSTNPLIVLWNRVFVIVPTHFRDEKGLEVEHKVPVQLQNDLSLWNLTNWLSSLFGFTESWLRSRRYRDLISGLPFLAATICGVSLTLWLRHGSDEGIINSYRTGLVQAQRDQDTALEETYIRALCALRSHDSAFRFQLGLFKVNHGHVADGLRTIQTLTPEATDGYPPARLWLVRQALQPQPLLALDRDAIERQLLTVLKQQPDHFDVHLLLSEIYFERGEAQLAERHLTEAARFKPELNLQLARLKRTLEHSPESIVACAQRAVSALWKKLELDRSDVATRVALAEAQLVTGNDSAARETLSDGLRQSEDLDLKKALANFDFMQIDRRLNSSPLNREACLPNAIAALQLDPSSVAGLQMVARLQKMGAKISADSVQSAIAHWESEVAGDPTNQNHRILLSQLLFSAGQLERAIEVLSPIVDSRPEMRTVLVQILQQAGRTDGAAAILRTIIEEAKVALESDINDDAAAAAYAEALLLLGQNDDARLFLKERATDSASNSAGKNSTLVSLYGRVCLAEYDRMTGFDPATFDINGSLQLEIPETADRAVLLELLRDALKCSPAIVPAIDRLSLLSFSAHPAAEDAGRLIRELRLEGEFGAEVLNKLGMLAIMLKKYDTARTYLDQANARSRGMNPVILNNLAIAIIRTDTNDADKALALANIALGRLPENPDVLSTRGEIYLALSRWNDAIADLTDSMKNRAPNAELHRLLESAYTGMPDPDMAADHARKAAELEGVQVQR